MKRDDLYIERIRAELNASLEQLNHWHEKFISFQLEYPNIDEHTVRALASYISDFYNGAEAFCKEIKSFQKCLR